MRMLPPRDLPEHSQVEGDSLDLGQSGCSRPLEGAGSEGLAVHEEMPQIFSFTGETKAMGESFVRGVGPL